MISPAELAKEMERVTSELGASGRGVGMDELAQALLEKYDVTEKVKLPRCYISTCMKVGAHTHK